MLTKVLFSIETYGSSSLLFFYPFHCFILSSWHCKALWMPLSISLSLSQISKSPLWYIPGVPLAGLTESQGVPQPPRPRQLLQSLWLARVCVSEPLERTGHLWVWGVLCKHTESTERIQTIYLQIFKIQIWQCILGFQPIRLLTEFRAHIILFFYIF